MERLLVALPLILASCAGGEGGSSGTTGGQGAVLPEGGSAGVGGTGGVAAGGVVSPGTGGVTGGASPSTGGAPPSTGGMSATGGAPGGAGATSGGSPSGGATSTGGAPAGGGGAGGSSAGSAGAGGDATGGAGGDGGGGATSAGVGGAPDSVPLDPALLDDCTGTSPVACALDLSNGNYDITVELGSQGAPASSWVKAETRRFEVEETATLAGDYALFTFTVNVRQEQHDGGQSAPGNVLDLEIGGATPALHGLGVRPAPSAITVFVAGDSTVCDWDPSSSSSQAEDQAGWAQELSLYLGPGVAVANYADSGETAASFYSKFFGPARTAMKAGDYLFIQFGHNDQKNAADVSGYQDNLMRYVTDARDRDVTPVILTPVSRSSGSTANPGFEGLDQEARDLAAQENVALIDLTVLSREYYAAVDKNTVFIDGTHFHEVGAVGVAGVVAEAIRSSDLPLRDYLR